MIHQFKKIISRAKSKSMQASLRLASSFHYLTHLSKGGNTDSRMEKYKRLNYTGKAPERSQKERLALFVAFHDSLNVPLSNLEYLKSLLDCKFRIIYIHNGELQEKAIQSIKPFCERIICRENIGQDFGAWKDAILFFKNLGYLNDIEWLLLCNDSNFFVGGKNAKSFIRKFTSALDESIKDLITLNLSNDLTVHFQSYFLCLRKTIFNSKDFKMFWKNYLPLTDRHYAINGGELKFSKKVLVKFSFECLYDPSKLLKQILIDDSDVRHLPRYVPQSISNEVLRLTRTFQLASSKSPEARNLLVSLLGYLESFNPSHAFGILYFKYLNSPFLKKDLVRVGSYSLTQITSVLDEVLEEFEIIKGEEILDQYSISGNQYSLAKTSSIEIYKKGLKRPDDFRHFHLDRQARKKFI